MVALNMVLDLSSGSTSRLFYKASAYFASKCDNHLTLFFNQEYLIRFGIYGVTSAG